MGRTKIKQIIRESGHTYESLGGEIGISPQAVSEIVSGRTKGKTARYALAVALGMSVEDLWPESLSATDHVPIIPGGSSSEQDLAEDLPAGPPLRRQDLRSVERVAAVQATGLLSSPPDARLERIVRLAQLAVNGALSVLSIIDGHRQHIVAQAGGDSDVQRIYPADVGACPYVVAEGTELVVSNLSQDRRFKTDQFLEDANARSYLGMPVRDVDGHILGALAVMDNRPRLWSQQDTRLMEDLAQTTSEIVGARDYGAELTRTRKELAEVRQLFGQLVDQSQDVFWMSHPYTSRAQYLSSAFEAVYGWPRERLSEDNGLLDMIHPEDRARVAAGFAKQVLGAHTHEYRVIHRDGSVHWIRSRSLPVRDKDGETYRVAGIARDVTAEKATEGFLQTALERFFSTDPPGGELYWMGDAHGEHWVFKASGETAARFGPMPDPAHGREWWEARIHPDDRERVFESVSEALHFRSGLWHLEYRFAAADGEFYRMRATAYLVLGCQPARSVAMIKVLGAAP